eukprot:CAMPEP_0184281658 /NCGR_PEP_ID=MMETSP0977-20130417/61656_1 /TAXON_ID=483370 /ORGANISM="non described non described, Strain CCMP2097" /LENGTH=101 /DNA_ID=CAMNT_0026587639 /DNA_START=54 /DNA_END=356 /DNA_ORIENTATION=-
MTTGCHIQPKYELARRLRCNVREALGARQAHGRGRGRRNAHDDRGRDGRYTSAAEDSALGEDTHTQRRRADSDVVEARGALARQPGQERLDRCGAADVAVG